MKGCEHKWEGIAESRYSDNYWCEKCGAWKRHDLETGQIKTYHPKLGVKP